MLKYVKRTWQEWEFSPVIPLRLTLRNFMCYRQPPPLDLSAVHLVCLSGDNGNGKSALIYAMTWAAWGTARSNSSDDLISQGQNEMAVEFDLAVGSQPYRIIRKRSRPKKVGQAGQNDFHGRSCGWRR